MGKQLRNRLKNALFTSRISLLVDDAQNKWLRDLGKNDFIHSENVESLIGRMLPPEIINDENKLQDAEILLLLYAVYLHDISRKFNDMPGEGTLSGRRHEFLSAEEIENNFEKYKLNDKFEAHAVAEIIRAHASESDCPIENVDFDYGIQGLSDKGINLQFLGALLRISDELDNCFRRVQDIESEQDSPRNIVRFVKFDWNRSQITIQAEPKSIKESNFLIFLRRQAQKRLDEVKPVLEKHGIYYQNILLDQGKIKPPARPGKPVPFLPPERHSSRSEASTLISGGMLEKQPSTIIARIVVERRMGRTVEGEMINILFGTRMLVGRDTSCDMFLPDESVSRKHALIRIEQEVVRMVDLGSTNGTTRNNEPVTEEIILETGDMVGLGQGRTFEVKIVERDAVVTSVRFVSGRDAYLLVPQEFIVGHAQLETANQVDVKLYDPSILPMQARIEFFAGKTFIISLDPSRPVIVNSHPVDELEIMNNYMIEVGDTLLRFERMD